MAKSGSYGLKEVADVIFWSIPTSGPGLASFTQSGDSYTVTVTGATKKYEFDSLKVSNIEVSSEDTSARGGKGNPELISWSYGKEVTLTIEDALFSEHTLELMFGGKDSLDGEANGTIIVDANSFPDMYTITGTTVMRSYDTGKDEPFGFVIPKGKVNVGGTLTMEAEGDPSTFEMTIKAMSAIYNGNNDVLIQFQKLTPGT